LPDLPTPKERVTIHGLAKVPESNPFISGAGINDKSRWPKIAQQLIIAAFSSAFEKPLTPTVLLLDENNPGSFKVEWQITPMPPEKHIGYAIQWFAMAFTLLIIYVAINSTRVRKL
jgi:surfeit locus 1 family protein